MIVIQMLYFTCALTCICFGLSIFFLSYTLMFCFFCCIRCYTLFILIICWFGCYVPSMFVMSHFCFLLFKCFGLRIIGLKCRYFNFFYSIVVFINVCFFFVFEEIKVIFSFFDCYDSRISLLMYFCFTSFIW